jgi:hypothetical protein
VTKLHFVSKFRPKVFHIKSIPGAEAQVEEDQHPEEGVRRRGQGRLEGAEAGAAEPLQIRKISTPEVESRRGEEEGTACGDQVSILFIITRSQSYDRNLQRKYFTPKLKKRSSCCC